MLYHLQTKRFALALIGLSLLTPLALAGRPALAAETSRFTGVLTALSGVTLPVTLTLQIDVTSYTVNVTSSTQLVRKFNGASSFDEFAIGDQLRVTGTLTNTTIDATSIKDLSIQRIGGTFGGSILSIDTTASTFLLDAREREDQTVTVTGATKVFQGNRQGTFADLAVGQTVKVIGVWRKAAHQVRADRILIKLTELNGTIRSTDCVGNVLTVQRNGHQGEAWTVALTADTVLRDRLLNPISCANLGVNDRVAIRGLKTGEHAVRALQLVDKGVKKTPTAINGEIESIDATAQTFVVQAESTERHGKKLKKSSTEYTASLTSESILVDSTGKLITFDKLAVGHDVSIRGTVYGVTVIVNLLIDKDLE